MLNFLGFVVYTRTTSCATTSNSPPAARCQSPSILFDHGVKIVKSLMPYVNVHLERLLEVEHWNGMGRQLVEDPKLRPRNPVIATHFR